MLSISVDFFYLYVSPLPTLKILHIWVTYSLVSFAWCFFRFTFHTLLVYCSLYNILGLYIIFAWLLHLKQTVKMLFNNKWWLAAYRFLISLHNSFSLPQIIENTLHTTGFQIYFFFFKIFQPDWNQWTVSVVYQPPIIKKVTREKSQRNLEKKYIKS